MNKTELEALVGHKRPHKYGAKWVTCKQGHRHPSKAEAMHCWDLYAQMKANLIRDLEYQKCYELLVNGVKVGTHKPDFTFKRPKSRHIPTGPNSAVAEMVWDDPQVCVDEVKGFRTSDWIFRSKIFQALYPQIHYREVR